MFDNDGTLWCEKPGPIQSEFLFRQLARMAEREPGLAERQPWKAVLERDYAWLGGAIEKHYRGDNAELHAMVDGLLQCYVGLTTDEFARAAGDFLRSGRLAPGVGRAPGRSADRPGGTGRSGAAPGRGRPGDSCRQRADRAGGDRRRRALCPDRRHPPAVCREHHRQYGQVDVRQPQPSLVWIPGGQFRMGSDRHYPGEAPPHPVRVSGFWMAATVVTNAEFARFVDATAT